MDSGLRTRGLQDRDGCFFRTLCFNGYGTFFIVLHYLQHLTWPNNFQFYSRFRILKLLLFNYLQVYLSSLCLWSILGFSNIIVAGFLKRKIFNLSASEIFSNSRCYHTNRFQDHVQHLKSLALDTFKKYSKSHSQILGDFSLLKKFNKISTDFYLAYV